MNVKRRKQPLLPRFPGLVLPQRDDGSSAGRGAGVPSCRDLLFTTAASAERTESFVRLFGQVAFWLGLLILLSGQSFSMLYSRLGEYSFSSSPYRSRHSAAAGGRGAVPPRTKHYARAAVIAAEGVAPLSEFFRQPPPVSEWDAFALAAAPAASPSSAFASSYVRRPAVTTATTNASSSSHGLDVDGPLFARASERLRASFVDRYGAVVSAALYGRRGGTAALPGTPDSECLARGLLHRAYADAADEYTTHDALTSNSASPPSRPAAAVRLQEWARRLSRPLGIGLEKEGGTSSPTLRILALGGSTAAGAGNYRGQAYSRVLERLLAPPIRALRPGQSKVLHVHHATFPDEEEWPLVWCFLSQLRDYNDDDETERDDDGGDDDDDEGDEHNYSTGIVRKNRGASLPHIILWDYAETSSPAKLEMFLRTVAAIWNNRTSHQSAEDGGGAFEEDHPLLVFRNLDAKGVSLLQYYGRLPVSLVLNGTDAAQPMLDLDPAVRPPGFVRWTDWGDDGGGSASQRRADPAGQHRWMTVQQHEWMAWLVTMHVLAALEYATAGTAPQEAEPVAQPSPERLPSPLYLPTNEPWSPLVLGDHAPKLQCFSTYVWRALQANGSELVPVESKAAVERNETEGEDEEPTRKESIGSPDTALLRTGPGQVRNHLSRLTQQGAVQTPMELLLLPQRSFSSAGWVLDLDAVSKRAKQRTSPQFRGFDDWKAAYQGSVSSPPLVLSVPYNVRGLWLCESSAPAIASSSGVYGADSSCSLERDVAVRLVGRSSPLPTVPVGAVSAFEKAHPCLQVQLPERPAYEDDDEDNPRRLELSLQVTNAKVTYTSGPCSLAHVLYVV